ncbi:uncharacterized protein [Salminus brasiliensis]|uniref:uncharacterized protein n=1 Tax=Salminus brasiliensis TaxID=930266 RepID=UPI003B82E107
MNRLETLNEMTHLQRSRFGRTQPRHGLKLLYWFASDCISLEYSNITSEYDPENGDFGFHYFENRFDRNGVKLLPDVDLPYYVVGNLNSAGADELPEYVREDYTGLQDNSNMDRIIVSLDCDCFSRVYVTEHDDRTNYNPCATYRISKGLLKVIKNLELEEFLTKAGYQGHPGFIYQLPLMIFNHRGLQTPDRRPTNSVASTVRPHTGQDCRVEIESESESESESSSYVRDRTVLRYSDMMSSRNRSRCCECTIL